jgi:hypothetical protein
MITSIKISQVTITVSIEVEVQRFGVGDSLCNGHLRFSDHFLVLVEK